MRQRLCLHSTYSCSVSVSQCLSVPASVVLCVPACVHLSLPQLLSLISDSPPSSFSMTAYVVSQPRDTHTLTLTRDATISRRFWHPRSLPATSLWSTWKSVPCSAPKRSSNTLTLACVARAFFAFSSSCVRSCEAASRVSWQFKVLLVRHQAHETSDARTGPLNAT